VERNTKFAKSLEVDYPILSDPGKKVARAYGVVTSQRPVPYRWTFYIGKDGKILKVDRKVKAATDGETAAATLKALGVEAAK
jgi:peroxiredoxin Q/BCP